MKAQMSTEQLESPQGTGRGKASEYIERIRLWQIANGGFHRVPPRSFDEKLNNWVQRARYDYRNGALSTMVADELIALGLIQVDTPDEPRESQSQYDRAMWAMCVMKRMGAEDNNGPNGEDLRENEALAQWLEDIKKLAVDNPRSMLLSDLRWMMPRVFNSEIEPSMPESGEFKTDRRNGVDLTMETFRFAKRRGRLPDLTSPEVIERKMASWLIRIETGFEAVAWNQLAEKDGNATAVESLLDLLRNADPKQRDAQWRWWSSVAMECMRNPKPGSRWQDRIYMLEPEYHCEQLELNLSNVRAGKPGWQGGPWGVDPMCIGISAGKSVGSNPDERREETVLKVEASDAKLSKKKKMRTVE